MSRQSRPRFPDGFEIAFYDYQHTRVTPWFDANGAYIGTPETAGTTVRWLAVRQGGECDHLSVHDYYMTLTEGVPHVAQPSEQLVRDLANKVEVPHD